MHDAPLSEIVHCSLMIILPVKHERPTIELRDKINFTVFTNAFVTFLLFNMHTLAWVNIKPLSDFHYIETFKCLIA